MKIAEVISALERFAPLPLQDSYDNAGLQAGLTDAECTGALLCLDVTEPVVDEAARRGCNLIVSHHPLLFHGLKQLSGRNYIERCVIKAIVHGIVICSMHTNMDNAPGGVSFKMGEKLGLRDVEVLEPISDRGQQAGAGVIGTLPENMTEDEFLHKVKNTFRVGCVMHTRPTGRTVSRVALCGGAGAFLIQNAVAAGADAYVTGEIKYHEFFGHEDEILLAAIGHYESEQFTVEIFNKIIRESFPSLPVRVTEVNTNPINYL